MNKIMLMEKMQKQLEENILAIKEAAMNTLEAATHEESKAENKYDTRGLEASYLAGAQAKRVRELEDQLAAFKSTRLREFTPQDPIAPTALVEVELNERRSFVFILERGGGLILRFEDYAVQAIAPTSPLGRALLGARANDDIVVESPESHRTYHVISVK